MGLHGSDTAELTLDAVEVDDDALMGEVGDGFKIAMSALDSGRYRVAAGCVGICQGSLDASVAYAKEREQFGRPIASFQLVQAMIADMRVQTDAARMLVYRAGFLKDQGRPSHHRDVDRQALRDRGGAELRAPRDPGPRRLGLRRRPPGRALLPRRAGDDALRGHLADPEADHRARGDRHQRAHPVRPDRRRPGRRHHGCRDRAARGGVGRATRSSTTPTRPPWRAGSVDRQRLAREVEKGRLAAGKAGMVEAAEELDELIVADIVIEAAPESLELKRNLFGRVAGIVRDDCVLASNTSSLSVTEIAAGVPVPERVVGMHFFNPRAGDEAGRGRGRRALRRGRARDRARARARDGQPRDRRGRRPGLPRQPLQPAVRPRGAADRAGRAGDGRAGRPHLPPRRRLPHGPVRADGPGRDRRRLRGLEVVLRAVVRRAALAALDAGRAQGRRRASTGARPGAAGTSTPTTASTGPPTRAAGGAAATGSW